MIKAPDMDFESNRMQMKYLEPQNQTTAIYGTSTNVLKASKQEVHNTNGN